MKIKIQKLSVLALLLMATSFVRAGNIDFRAGAGMSAANPKGFENRVRDLSGKELNAKSFDTYNADLIFHLPVIPMTLGVRYEEASQKRSDSSSEWKLNVNNLALLVDFRIINSKIYLGPIVSVGYPWADLDFKNSGSNESHRLNSHQLSYSGGLETGIYLGPFLIGAEAGYKSVRLKSEGSSSSSSVNTNIHLDGFYGKAMVGFTFL